jgi:hypothetical protein
MEMINLLPTSDKEDIVFGRRNRILLHWIIAVILVITAVGAMTVFGQFYINKNTRSLEAVAEITQQRIANQNLQSTQQQIQNLSNNFKTVSQLLGRQLLFSKLLIKIGSIIPSRAVLSGITLSTSTSALDLNVIAENREAATQAFVNINDPANGLFNKADLLSVDCNVNTPSTTQAQTKYPCTASIKVVIKTDSSFYFLNSITSSGAKN